MKKRLVVILLSLTLIFTLIPMTAFAADETVTITLKASTIDNSISISYSFAIPKGQSLSNYWNYNRDKYNDAVAKFTVNGYDFYPDFEPVQREIGQFESNDDLKNAADNCFKEKRNESCTLFVPLFRIIKTAKLKLDSPPVCGDEVSLIISQTDNGSLDMIQTNCPQITPISEGVAIYKDAHWETDGEDRIVLDGTIEGEKIYRYYFDTYTTTGYIFADDTDVEILGTEVEDIYLPKRVKGSVLGKVKAVHNWDNGEITKAPTVGAEGVKTFTCEDCGITKNETIPKLEPPVEPPAEPPVEPGSDPTQMGSDGTAVGEGASAAAAEQKITGMKTDTDPKGSKFNKLRLRSTYQTKTSITLKWKSNKKAAKYVIYGNRCGSSTKIRKSVKLYTVKKSSKTTMTKVIKKVKGAKLKKNTYYKFLVVALNKKNEVVSTSRMIHVATKGGKYTNYKSISVDKEKITKAKNLKKGKSLKLEAKQVKVTKSLKARKHVPIRYESTNKNIAKVTSKGVIKALKKGSCYVYVYAQNGVYKKIKVVVK